MNTMADNIGGNTIHSFANISFKDRRGIEIKPHTNKDGGGICGEEGNLHELRFILLDEVEAAGAELIGNAKRTCASRYRLEAE